MDVVNGKIVETVVRASGETTATTREESRVMAMDHNFAWRGFHSDGDIRSGEGDSTRVADQQELWGRPGQGGDQEWAPSWAPSSFSGDERMTTTPTLPKLQGPRNYNKRQHVMEPERTSRAGDFSGLQQAPPVACHRPGRNRCSSNSGAGGFWGMVRVENGQTAEFARPGSEGVDHVLGLKPSGACVEDAGCSRRQKLCFRGKRDHLSGSFVLAAPAAPSWAGGLSCNSSDQPMASWSRHGLAPAPARLMSDYSKPRGYGFPGFQQQQQQQLMHHDHRQGWKWSHTGSSSAFWSSDQCHHHFDRTPCSEGKLDEEMTLFESQITRTVSGHYSDLASFLGQELPSSAEESAAAAAAHAVEEANDVAAEDTKSSELKSSVLNCKRKSSELSDGVAQGEFGRIIQPLKLLVRKELTVSDVGELGRIVVPKKDAESPSFPKIDTKEGAVLEMNDYIALKRWYFRFKYWINSKSRMYVLENTGEFIKYHSLKENDIFIVCEDVRKNLVVCGQKIGTGGDSLDPTLESPGSERPASGDVNCLQIDWEQQIEGQRSSREELHSWN